MLCPRWGGAVYTAFLIALLLMLAGRSASMIGYRLIVWTIPFTLPLILIHGVLNSQFPVTNYWLDLIPLRSEGLYFGIDLAIRIMLFSVVGAYWLSVDRDAMVESLIQFRLPIPIIMLAMHGFVMARLVQERIHAIHLAQRARGIPVSASFRERLASIPALLIPVVVGAFVEAEARIPVLLAHGYGRLALSSSRSRLELRTIVQIVATLFIFALSVLLDRYLWPTYS